ncbi:MAG: tail fiber assembly protein [Alphaproteobacteria bacterium]
MSDIYKINQIFENDYPPEAAVFCNKNNLQIVQIETMNGKKRFRIQKVPVLSDEKKAQNLRNERNELLRLTDFTQINDTPLDEKEKSAYAAYRQYLRDLPSQQGFPNITILSYGDWTE